MVEMYVCASVGQLLKCEQYWEQHSVAMAGSSVQTHCKASTKDADQQGLGMCVGQDS